MSSKKTEEFLIKRFSRDLEILDNLDEEKMPRLAEKEYRDILHLAKKLGEVDFSKDSKVREELKKKLISAWEKRQCLHSDLCSQELDLDELDHVTAGVKNDQDNPFLDDLEKR